MWNKRRGVLLQTKTTVVWRIKTDRNGSRLSQFTGTQEPVEEKLPLPIPSCLLTGCGVRGTGGSEPATRGSSHIWRRGGSQERSSTDGQSHMVVLSSGSRDLAEGDEPGCEGSKR